MWNKKRVGLGGTEVPGMVEDGGPSREGRVEPGVSRLVEEGLLILLPLTWGLHPYLPSYLFFPTLVRF